MVQRSRKQANDGFLLSVIEQALTNQEPSVISPLIRQKIDK